MNAFFFSFFFSFVSNLLILKKRNIIYLFYYLFVWFVCLFIYLFFFSSFYVIVIITTDISGHRLQIVGHRASSFPDDHDADRADSTGRVHRLPQKVKCKFICFSLFFFFLFSPLSVYIPRMELPDLGLNMPSSYLFLRSVV
jgi:hypothetical protein